MFKFIWKLQKCHSAIFFINLTQECDPRVKYLSDLFNQFINVYVVNGNNFTTIKAKNDDGRINLINETFQELKSFQPPFQGANINQNIGIHPMQHVSNNFNPTMYYGSPGEPMNYSQMTNNTIPHKMIHVKTEKDSVCLLYTSPSPRDS